MNREILDKIVDKLQKEAAEKCEKEIENRKSYWQGYMEGCEDFHRKLRRLPEKEEKADE